MEFKSYLVINDKPRCYDGEEVDVTVQGMQIFNIGQLVPIIQSGKGCIGLAHINELHIRSTATTVIYTYSELSDEKAGFLYGLYRNNVSMNRNSGSGDIYDNEDMIIPGAFGRKAEPKPSHGRGHKGSGFNLSDYL